MFLLYLPFKNLDMDKRTTYILASIALLMLVAVSNLFAGAPPPPPPPPLSVPVDAGAAVLLAAGAVIGGKYIYDKRKAKSEDQPE